MKTYIAVIVFLTSIACNAHHSENDEGHPIKQLVEQLQINYRKYEFNENYLYFFKDLHLNDDDLKDIILSVRFKDEYSQNDNETDPSRIYFFLINRGNGLYKVENIVTKVLNIQGLDGGGRGASYPMNTSQKDELVLVEAGIFRGEINWKFSFYFKYIKSIKNWMLQKVVQEKCNQTEMLDNPRGLTILKDCNIVGEIKEDGKKSIEKVNFNDYYRDGRGIGVKDIFSN